MKATASKYGSVVERVAAPMTRAQAVRLRSGQPDASIGLLANPRGAPFCHDRHRSERAAEDAAKTSGASRFAKVDFSGRSFLTVSIGKAAEPVPVLQWPKRLGLPTTSDIFALATVMLGKAIADMRRRNPQAVSSALFLAPLEVCLRVRDAEGREDMRQVAAQILTASARLRPWMSDPFAVRTLGCQGTISPS
jgi:hypothetical protein